MLIQSNLSENNLTETLKKENNKNTEWNEDKI